MTNTPIKLGEVIDASFRDAQHTLLVAVPPSKGDEGFRIEIDLSELILADYNLGLVHARVKNARLTADNMIAQHKAQREEAEAKAKEKADNKKAKK